MNILGWKEPNKITIMPMTWWKLLFCNTKCRNKISAHITHAMLCRCQSTQISSPSNQSHDWRTFQLELLSGWSRPKYAQNSLTSNRWPRICYASHNRCRLLFFVSYITGSHISHITTSTTSDDTEAETTNPSGIPMFALVFGVIRIVRFCFQSDRSVFFYVFSFYKSIISVFPPFLDLWLLYSLCIIYPLCHKT